MPILDWLICGHVALDKCSVSLGAASKQLLPAPYRQKQNGRFELASFDFISRNIESLGKTKVRCNLLQNICFKMEFTVDLFVHIILTKFICRREMQRKTLTVKN